MIISLNDKQYDFINSTKQNNGLVAGLGAGKSYVATLKCIMMKIQYPLLTVAYYLPNYGLIRDIAWDKFPDLLEQMGYKYRINKSDKEIHIEGAGKIIFRSMDNPQTIVGYEVFYSLIDECDILPMEKMEVAYNKILARNRQKADIPNQMDIVGTPEGFKFFYKRYVTNINHDTDALFQASTLDNKHLPDGYIKQLQQQYPENLLKAYLNGDFVNLSTGTIFSYFKRETHHSNIIDNGSEFIILGQDFNIGSCITIVFVRRGSNIIAVDEFSSYDTMGIIQNTKDRYSKRSLGFYPDASGNNRKTNASDTDIQMIQKAGFSVFVNKSNPAVKDRINITNNLLSKGTFLVNTIKCPEFTKALEQHSYNDKQEPEKYNQAGSVDDYTDAGTYPLAFLYPIVTNKYIAVQG